MCLRNNYKAHNICKEENVSQGFLYLAELYFKARFLFFFFLRFYPFIFREKEREKKRERNIYVREKHQSATSPHTWANGDWTCNPGICPDWELNQWHFASQHNAQPISRTGQGSNSFEHARSQVILLYSWGFYKRVSFSQPGDDWRNFGKKKEGGRRYRVEKDDWFIYNS